MRNQVSGSDSHVLLASVFDHQNSMSSGGGVEKRAPDDVKFYTATPVVGGSPHAPRNSFNVATRTPSECLSET